MFDAAMAYSKRLDWFFLVRTPSGIENPRIASTLDLGIAALVGTLLFGLLLANPGWGRGSWLERQAPKVLGLYCLHMMLVVWLMIFGPQGKQVWWELLKVPALLALTLLGYRLLAATALSRWLLRAR